MPSVRRPVCFYTDALYIGGSADDRRYVYQHSLGMASTFMRTYVPTGISLDYLAEIILKAFDFDNDHLYEFVFKNGYGITERIVHPYIEEHCGVFTSECVVGELPPYQGMELMFHFDFGDDWRFQLVVESISTEDNRIPEPKVIEQHGEPPEQYPENFEAPWD